jgi:DNA-directed RNA polymerase specialized sigma24 family protein
MLAAYQMEFPRFDLSRLTQKQLDVVVMRYVGGLSWRKIAALEGVKQVSVRDRHDLAMRKLTRQF